MGFVDEWKQDGVEWDEAPDLWEHQGEPMTVGALARALLRVNPELPVHVFVHDGTGAPLVFHPVELGYVDGGERPGAVVFTVADLGTERRGER